jgi:hypothetical protein
MTTIKKEVHRKCQKERKESQQRKRERNEDN